MMPAVGLSTMEYILRALFILCLGFTSCASAVDFVTSQLSENGPAYQTTLNNVIVDITTVVNELSDTTSVSRGEKDNDEDLLLTTNVDGLVSYTTDISITSKGKQTKRIALNETTDHKPNSTSSLTTTEVFMTTSSNEDAGFYSKNGPEVNTQMMEEFSATTLQPIVAFTRDLSTTTLKPTVKVSSTSETTPKVKFTTSSKRLEEVTQPSQKIPPTVTYPKAMDNTKNRFDIDGPIGEDLARDFTKPISELSGHTKAFVEQTYYEHSPEYLQRQTINHAAIWITVGFVAILLTYILALFIHEKGRSEWRLATQDYSRFENESDSTRDDTSITIDLDSSSTTAPSTSTAVPADKAKDITPEPQVVDTTRSH